VAAHLAGEPTGPPGKIPACQVAQSAHDVERATADAPTEGLQFIVYLTAALQTKEIKYQEKVILRNTISPSCQCIAEQYHRFVIFAVFDVECR